MSDDDPPSADPAAAGVPPGTSASEPAQASTSEPMPAKTAAPATGTIPARALLIAGAAVSLVVVIALIVIVVVIGSGSGAPPEASPAAMPASRVIDGERGGRTGVASLWELREGDCLGAFAGERSFAYHLVDCDELHAAEVWYRAPVPADWGGATPDSPYTAAVWLRPTCSKILGGAMLLRPELTDELPELRVFALGWTPTRFAADGTAGLCVVVADPRRFDEDQFGIGRAAVRSVVGVAEGDDEPAVQRHTVSILDLETADCLEESFVDPDLLDPGALTVVPCADPHATEVWIRFAAPPEWSAESPPTQDDVNAHILTACRSIFRTVMKARPELSEQYPELRMMSLPALADKALTEHTAGQCLVTNPQPLVNRVLFVLFANVVGETAERQRPRDAPS